MWIEVPATTDELNSAISGYLETSDTYTNWVTSLENIVFDETLQGLGYSALKARIANNELFFAEGVRDYHAALYGCYKTHLGALESSLGGEGRLDGTQLGEQIAAIKEHLALLEERTSMPGALLDTMNTRQVNSSQRLIDLLQDKLDRLEAYSADTQAIYSEVETLMVALTQGASYIAGIVWDAGTQSFIGTGDESWRANLASARAAVQDDLLQLAREGVYGDEEGMYGGSQMNLFPYLKEGEGLDALKELLDRHGYTYFSGLDDVSLRYLARQMQETGCAYVALANSIMEQYYFRPGEFERTFGFPLFRIEDGKKVLNFELLTADLYCYMHQEVFYDHSNGYVNLNLGDYSGLPLNITDAFFPQYISDRTRGKETVTSSHADFSHTTDYTQVIKENTVILCSYSGSSYTPLEYRNKYRDETLNAFYDEKTQKDAPQVHAVVLLGANESPGCWGNSPFTCSNWGYKYSVSALGHRDYSIGNPFKEGDVVKYEISYVAESSKDLVPTAGYNEHDCDQITIISWN